MLENLELVVVLVLEWKALYYPFNCGNSRFWMACVSHRDFSNAVGATALKPDLTVEELDRVDFGLYLNEKRNEGM